MNDFICAYGNLIIVGNCFISLPAVHHLTNATDPRFYTSVHRFFIAHTTACSCCMFFLLRDLRYAPYFYLDSTQ